MDADGPCSDDITRPCDDVGGWGCLQCPGQATAEMQILYAMYELK